MKNLLKKEWIYGKWIVLMVTVLLIVSSIQIFGSYLGDIKSREQFDMFLGSDMYIQNYWYGKTSIIVMAIVIFVVFLVMMSDYLNGGYEVLSSMPYTRKQIIISKWIMAEISIIVPLIINYCVIIVMYFINYNIVNAFNILGTLFQWMILSLCVYIFTTTFVMFIQSLHGNNIVGAITNAFILVCLQIGGGLLESFFQVYGLKIYIRDGIYMLPFFNDMSIDYSVYLKIFVLIAFSIVFLCLMTLSFRKIPLEKRYNFIFYKSFRYLLRVCLVIMSTMFVVCLIFDKGGVNPLLVGIVTIVMLVPITFVSIKTIY
ncbi:hypothetical protein [Clostridium felsineum]|uniref:hypothetical protein n=1 Tax=Clostridium felsineum TaxID=36839 RepID=UPI00098BF8B2|nr:hypothetical protein [Clostridium felsineum]URZ18434.1 hypothetical protein CLFE_045200 [Clostridium felsineum DSM 794]